MHLTCGLCIGYALLFLATLLTMASLMADTVGAGICIQLTNGRTLGILARQREGWALLSCGKEN
jgi:hypothetical protein